MLHQSVLLEESLTGLAIKPEGIYVDGTFGRGGHSRAILQRLSAKGRLIAIDKDLTAIEYGQATFGHDPRLTLYHASFKQMLELTKDAGVYGQVDGILLDLGVSSPQLDDAVRGFSFMKPGPLDMRMNLEQAMSAADWVNQADLDEMIHVFREYGEERYARRIANAIIAEREKAPILTTEGLAEIVKQANPKWEKHKHPATRVFQAIRIYINRELDDLQDFLNGMMDILSVGGRLVIISFHSLEDRIVKQFMRLKEHGPTLPKGLPVREVDQPKVFRRIGKAIMPSEKEMEHNHRARSAVLRIGEKLA